MSINPVFINTVIRNFYDALHNEQHDWCRVARFDAANGYYDDECYQKIYALRYLPAYYFEFCVLALELNNRVGSYSHVNIASLGCGLSPDYYALLENLKVDFNYYGYDVVDWSTRGLMPRVSNNFQMFQAGIGNIAQDQINEFDVYIFPKSIRDIYESDPQSLVNFAHLICTSNKSRVFFLNSFVTNNFINSRDLLIFLKIDNILKVGGFRCKDDVDKTYNFSSDRVSLIKLDSDFYYSPDKFVKCSDKGKEPICDSCVVTKSPIFTNQFMSFQVLEYIRE